MSIVLRSITRKMRSFLVIAYIVGVACGATVHKVPTGPGLQPFRQSRSLGDDWNDFLALIPLREIMSITLDYFADDEEVQQALVYLQSDDFESIIVYMDAQPELLFLLDFCYTHGLTEIYNVINYLHFLFGIPQIDVPAEKIKRSVSKRSLVQYFDDIAAVIPINDIIDLWNEKLETSEDFQELYDYLSSDEFHQFVLRVEALPETQELGDTLRNLGVDVDAVLEFIRDLFGWSAGTELIGSG